MYIAGIPYIVTRLELEVDTALELTVELELEFIASARMLTL
jgi:hypothetical protein